MLRRLEDAASPSSRSSRAAPTSIPRRRGLAVASAPCSGVLSMRPTGMESRVAPPGDASPRSPPPASLPCRRRGRRRRRGGAFSRATPPRSLPLDHNRRRELSELVIRRLGELARLPRSRWPTGSEPTGRRHGIVPQERTARVSRLGSRRPRWPRRSPSRGDREYRHARACARGVARPPARQAGRAGESIEQAVSHRLAGGGSWRRSLTLREPTAEQRRLLSLGPKLTELPAPAVGFASSSASSPRRPIPGELVKPRGIRLRERLGRVCVRHARRRGSTPSVPWWRSRRGRAFPSSRDARAARRLNEPRPAAVVCPTTRRRAWTVQVARVREEWACGRALVTSYR